MADEENVEVDEQALKLAEEKKKLLALDEMAVMKLGFGNFIRSLFFKREAVLIFSKERC